MALLSLQIRYIILSSFAYAKYIFLANHGIRKLNKTWDVVIGQQICLELLGAVIEDIENEDIEI